MLKVRGVVVFFLVELLGAHQYALCQVNFPAPKVPFSIEPSWMGSKTNLSHLKSRNHHHELFHPSRSFSGKTRNVSNVSPRSVPLGIINYVIEKDAEDLERLVNPVVLTNMKIYVVMFLHVSGFNESASMLQCLSWRWLVVS